MGDKINAPFAGNGVHEFARVVAGGVQEHVLDAACVHHRACAQHRHRVGDLAHHGKVVRDEEIGQPQVLLQLGEQWRIDPADNLIQALRDQIVPPTLNLHHPDEEAAGMNLVALQARPQKMRYALSNGFGFGGVNASLLLKRWE